MASYEKLPYRPCVGMMLINRAGLVFVGRRTGGPEHVDATHSWQMPQGGVDLKEEPYRAALRELHEETNVRSVEKLAESRTGTPTISRARSSARSGKASIAARRRNGSRCASSAPTARSTWRIPPADTSPNSSNGAGRRWSACPTWSCRSSGRSTSGWWRNFRASPSARAHKFPRKPRVQRTVETKRLRSPLYTTSGRRRVGQVVGRHVNGLHRGDRASLNNNIYK